jgi:hypothetical protein
MSSTAMNMPSVMAEKPTQVPAPTDRSSVIA